MTTSRNSSAEAWTYSDIWGVWERPWSKGTADVFDGGDFAIYGRDGIAVKMERVDGRSAIAAMEAADLAIAEMERKG